MHAMTLKERKGLKQTPHDIATRKAQDQGAAPDTKMPYTHQLVSQKPPTSQPANQFFVCCSCCVHKAGQGHRKWSAPAAFICIPPGLALGEVDP